MALTTDTLANLRTELRARLGYAAVADTTGPLQDLLNSFLKDAHDQLLIQYEWPELRRDWIFPCVSGQSLYAMPTDADSRTPDPERIVSVDVQVNQIWSPLQRGIPAEFYTIITSGIPTRYEIAHGNGDTLPAGVGEDDPVFELWQKPSSASYNIRIRAYALTRAFSADTDTTSADARLVFLMALANAKAHYQQADWQIYMNQLQQRLRKLRARSHDNMRYTTGTQWAPPPQPKIKGVDVP